MTPVEARPINPANYLIVTSRDGETERHIEITVGDTKMVDVSLGCCGNDDASIKETTVVIGACDGGWVKPEGREKVRLYSGKTKEIAGIKYTGTRLQLGVSDCV